MLENLFYWSDIRFLYFVLVWGLFGLLILLAFFPIGSSGTGAKRKPFRGIFFCVFLGLFIILGRWPGLFYYTAYNVDEAQIISNARTLVFDPVFFRSVDGASSGPMVVYPLLVPYYLWGWTPNYVTSRFIGLVMLAISAILFYLGLRRPAGEFAARMGALGMASFFAFTHFWDFVHYSSEHAPIFYLTIGTFFFLRIAFESEMSVRRTVVEAAIGAVFLSLILLAKLQAIYLGLFVGGCLLAAVVFRLRNQSGAIITGVGACMAGALFLPTAFAIWMWRCGTLEYFLKSYFGNALVYQKEGLQDTASIQVLWQMLSQAPDMFWLVFGFGIYCLGSLIFVGLFLRQSPHACRWVLLAFATAVLFLSYHTATVTLRIYLHYLLFLPFGLAIFVVAVAGILDAVSQARWQKCLASGLIFLGWIVPTAAVHAVQPNPWPGMGHRWQSKPLQAVENKILEAALGTNRILCVWGYMPYFYVNTGLRQATRLSTVSAQFNNNKYRDFFRTTFLDDLKQSKPGVFVDAVAPGNFFLDSPEQYAHKNIPQIDAWVAENYQLFDTVNGTRIYRWKYP